MEEDFALSAASRIVQGTGLFSFLGRESHKRGVALPLPQKPLSDAEWAANRKRGSLQFNAAANRRRNTDESSVIEEEEDELFKPRAKGTIFECLPEEADLQYEVHACTEDVPEEDMSMPDASAAFDPSRINRSSAYFLTQTRKARVYYLANDRERARLSVMRRREDISTDPMRKMRQTPGDVRYRRVLDRLDNFELAPGERMERSPVQKMFHRWFIQACLPWIYGTDWEANAQRVLKQHQLKRCYQEVFCISPRRFGKTLSMSSFSTAIQLEVRSVKIAVFSTGSRNSRLMMGLVRKFISQDPETAARIAEQNQECLAVASVPFAKGKSRSQEVVKQNQSTLDYAYFYSFPASVDGKTFFIHLILRREWVGWGTSRDTVASDKRYRHAISKTMVSKNKVNEPMPMMVACRACMMRSRS